MKKVFAVIAALVLAVPSFAQYSSGGFDLDKENLYYGVRIGMTGATLSGDAAEVKDLGSKVGLTLAGIIGLHISKTAPVFLESGLYYTERGAKKDKFSVGYNNLEIPVLVKYGIKATDEIALLPFVGPVFSYAISGKYKYSDGGTSVEVGAFDEKKWPNGNALKRANMGFKLGCGAEYNNLYLEAGYQFGITDISKGDDGIHSNALFVNFGVNF